MTAAIETVALTKFYGESRGIVDVSLAVKEGEVFGLLGPNGAGKTTTIRLLLDFIRPTSGSARVLGLDARQESLEIRRRTGYLPGDFRTYRNMTGQQIFDYFGHLRGSGSTKAAHYCERLGLDASRPFRELSKGNRQKVGLVQAFMSEPPLLILDEPTSGLDPLVQQEFHRMIAEARASGRSIFLSSHVLGEADALCDRVGIIRDGEIVAVEEIDALRARALKHMEIQFGEPVPAEAFSRLDGVRDVTVTDSRMACNVTGPVDAVVKAAAKYIVVDVTSNQPSLEEVFLAYYAGADPDAE
ncbi:MAG: ABC transporter ATP-binding protein [Dehalococcoidia bacterium]